MQDKNIITKARLLYYIENMSIAVLNSVYTSIDLVNGAKYQVINIVLEENDMSNFW